MPPRLMLLDAASMYFRAFHALPTSLTAPDGTPVNAVRGFLDSVARLVGDYPATRMVAALDADWRPQFRVDLLPSYKAHRVAVSDPTGRQEETPDALDPQVAVIGQVWDAFGLCRVGVTGFEADDVIATLASHVEGPVDVVTGDRDLFQLVDDAAGVRVLYTGRGMARLEVVDDAAVRARFGVAAAAYADFAALRGDPSDGIPGVKGVGEKSAAAVIERYPTIEALQAALADPSADVPHRRKLAAARDYLAVAAGVVRVRRDVPVPELDDEIPTKPRHPERLAALTEQWGLGASVARLVTALGALTRPR